MYCLRWCPSSVRPCTPDARVHVSSYIQMSYHRGPPTFICIYIYMRPLPSRITFLFQSPGCSQPFFKAPCLTTPPCCHPQANVPADRYRKEGPRYYHHQRTTSDSLLQSPRASPAFHACLHPDLPLKTFRLGGVARLSITSPFDTDIRALDIQSITPEGDRTKPTQLSTRTGKLWSTVGRLP